MDLKKGGEKMDLKIRKTKNMLCEIDPTTQTIILCGQYRHGKPIERVIETILEHETLEMVINRTVDKEIAKQLNNVTGWAIIGPLRITFGYAMAVSQRVPKWR